MTPEQKKHVAAVYTAAAEGKRTQWLPLEVEKWCDLDPFFKPDWVIQYPDRWRIAPEPKVRSWESTRDFPKVGSLWIRGKGDYREQMVISIANDVAFITASCGCGPVLCSNHIQDWRIDSCEWSSDRVTWHPCTVEVTE